MLQKHRIAHLLFFLNVCLQGGPRQTRCLKSGELGGESAMDEHRI